MLNNKKNIILQVVYQLAALLIPFVTAPYIARVLGASQSGVYSYTFSIVNYFMMFSMLGIDYYGNRSIAAVRDNREELNRVFSEILFAHIIISVAVIFIYLALILFIGGDYYYIFLIQAIFILGELLNINWFFAGLGNFKITVIRNLIIRTITVVCIFVFVKTSEDLPTYALIMATGSAISTSAVWVVLPKYVKVTKVPFSNAIRHLKPLFVLYIAIMAAHLMKMIDKTMLGVWGDMSQLGCYEYAEKIIKMPLAVVSAIGTVMLSSSSNLFSKGQSAKAIETLKTTINYLTVFCSLSIFGILAYGKEFSLLYLGDEYELTGSLLMILSISLLFNSWNDVLRTQYFIPQKKDRYYVIALVIGAVVNIILNIVFIQLYGAFGAAIATTFAYFIITIIELFFTRKEINHIRTIFWNLIPIALGVIPFGLSFYWKRIFSVSWGGLIAQIALFTVEFAVMFLLYLTLSGKLKIFLSGISFFKRRK